jgi:ribosomal protein L16 Arg81 hydroxylase
LSGRKKGVIFEPKNGNGLFPVLNQSWIDIESFNDKQLDYFVAMNDGYIADLEPGDALYFPMMMWHHFSYVDTGVSVNFRFGRKRNNDLLYRYVHADKFLQNLAWHLDFDEQAIIDPTLVMNEITAILERFYESPVKKRNDMRSLMKNLCSKFNIFEEQPIFTIKENDIIKYSEALNAISSQPYHFHNWTKYIGADDMLKTFANLARS